MNTQRQPRADRRGTRWIFGIVGAIATFLGVFILFGSEGQSVGIGGSLSWEVGEIHAAWGYGLLVGGIVLLMMAVWMMITGRAEAHPRTRRDGLTDLKWHASIFVLVNAFLWFQDIAIGGGLDYAYWTTVPWGIGLAIHALSYFFASPPPDTEPVEERVEEFAAPMT